MAEVALRHALMPKRFEPMATATGAIPPPSQPRELRTPAATARLTTGTDNVQPVKKRKGTPEINPRAWVIMRPPRRRVMSLSASRPPEMTPNTDATWRYAVAFSPAIDKLIPNFRYKNEGIHVRKIIATKFAPMKTAMRMRTTLLPKISASAPRSGGLLFSG